jgi:hypothetical protein
MKLTKSKLKQLIKEELQQLIKEMELSEGVRETLYHGIEWFEKQNRTKQENLKDNAHRDKVAKGHYAGRFDKKGFNDWLWKYYVPDPVKRGGKE